jgi:hypothetical protein
MRTRVGQMEQDAHMTRKYMVRKCPQIYKNITINCCDYKTTTRITNKERWLIVYICIFVGNVLTPIFWSSFYILDNKGTLLKNCTRCKGASFTTAVSIRHI